MTDTAESVGPGWRSLVQPLIDRCVAEGVETLQIKEKLGGLRFYVGGASPELQAAIDAAERASEHTCESCGATEGVEISGGWLKALCGPCREAKVNLSELRNLRPASAGDK